MLNLDITEIRPWQMFGHRFEILQPLFIGWPNDVIEHQSKISADQIQSEVIGKGPYDAGTFFGLQKFEGTDRLALAAEVEFADNPKIRFTFYDDLAALTDNAAIPVKPCADAARRALALHETSSAHSHLAHALKDLGQYDEAVEHYRKAAALPDRIVPLKYLRRHIHECKLLKERGMKGE